ncbi:MAG: tetratricopeptide repeat protein [Tannerellaceae bacterium]|nr:tetratricopeptide repeat protein [Tannerellaceae bacterium]
MDHIKHLISGGQTETAIQLLNELIENNKTNDEAYYLRGNAYRKTGNFKEALTNYLVAIELNPDSPAVQAHHMLMDILNFYNKDLYNP